MNRKSEKSTKKPKKTPKVADIGADHPYEPGQVWFFRTVTFHLVGRIQRVTRRCLILEEASHVGWPNAKHSDVVIGGQINDTEPLPDGTAVHIDAITDAQPWKHSLSRVRL